MRDLPPLLWAILVACLVPELVLSGADHGLWGSPHWRDFAVGWGGFWPGLLQDWHPNYPGQAWAMFVTYGFLHAGLLHLGANMMSLVSLGRAVEARAGTWGLARIYAAALVGGGAGYGILVGATVPMVGASGALFGLAGALVAWGYLDRKAMSEPLWPVWRACLWLVALNAGLWLVTGGALAWQTHLGGFLAGAALAWWEER